MWICTLKRCFKLWVNKNWMWGKKNPPTPPLVYGFCSRLQVMISHFVWFVLVFKVARYYLIAWGVTVLKSSKGQMWQIVPCRIPKQHMILITFFNKNVSRAVWLSSLRVTRICCLISEKRIVRILQNLVRNFVINCFMGDYDGFTK